MQWWERIAWFIAGGFVTEAIRLFRERLSKRLDRKEQEAEVEKARAAKEEEERIPLQILEVCYEHEERTGTYIAVEQARQRTGLSPADFDFGLGELKEWGAVEVLGSWSGDSIQGAFPCPFDAAFLREDCPCNQGPLSLL